MKHDDDDWIVLIDDSDVDMHEENNCEDTTCSCNTTVNSSDEDIAEAILNTSINSNTPLLTRAFLSKNKEDTSEIEETEKRGIIKSSVINTNHPSRFYFTMHTRKYQMIIVGLIIIQVILYCWACKNSDI